LGSILSDVLAFPPQFGQIFQVLGLEINDSIRLEENEHLFQILIFMEFHRSFFDELFQFGIEVFPHTRYESQKGF